MTTVIGGSSPAVTFPDSSTQSAAGLPSSGGNITGNLNVSGKIGVGTTTPTYNVEAPFIGVTGALNTIAASSGVLSQESGYTRLLGVGPNTSTAGTLYFYVASSNGANQDGMFLDSGGNFLMAPAYRTTPRGRVDISAPGGSISPTACLAMSRWGDAGTMVNFFPVHTSTTSIGNIYNAGLTSTQYNTSSDYRLKENIAPMTGALDKVALLKPCTYTWKSTGTHSQGFIAHELQEVIPEAVCGEKDEVNEDGSIKSQGIDTSFLVATLTAAIQELKATVDTQAITIAALQAKVGV